MANEPESLAIITRYLNSPENETFAAEITAFRAGSAENDSYFQEIEKIWRLSAKASVLDELNHSESIKKFSRSLSKNASKPVSIIRWLSGVAAAIIVALVSLYIYKAQHEVKFLVKTTGPGQIDSVKLADGSVVVLAENSELSYPEEFSKPVRGITFSSGKAFFKIAKNPGFPFEITMDKSTVTVLGTSFNIKRMNGIIDLSVKTGRVSFSTSKGVVSSVLTANQALSYDANKNELRSSEFQNADSWFTKELVFVDTPLEEVCREVGAYYNVNIKLETNEKALKKLNATFSDKNLDEVLDIIKETYNISIKKEKNQFTLITPNKTH